MVGSTPIARAVVVRGHVQGVSYRWSTMLQAERGGVVGWVRNEYDGSVRAHLEGSPADVTTLLEWMHHGPAGAHVDSVTETPTEVEGFSRFSVR